VIDFKKLRESKNQQIIINPKEIFRRLPKPLGINDLYTSQAEVLEKWFKHRNDKDVVIKLHTGGGKTLVGLLIAQSILNETHEPVIYICPNNQLVEQTIIKANEYGIPTVPYSKGSDFHDHFYTGKSVLVCNYHALFNGISKFGIRGGGKEIIRPGAIILDDAHVAFSIVRDTFTLKIERTEDEDGYNTLTNLFRNDFKEMSKLGTFDDIVSGHDFGILEVPYWSWKKKSSVVHEFIRANKTEEHKFVWPLIRDAFDYCHVLITKDSFVITPIFPLVDMIPAFYDCKRRIFMSATIGDDSAIIRTFEAKIEYVEKPLSSKSLAGVSERMILTPELMKFNMNDVPELLHKLTKHVSEKLGIATVILVTSDAVAKSWEAVANYPKTPAKVAESVKLLQGGTSKGPYVFANRYDGIDLPNDSCRLLISSGLPRGTSDYDLYLANTFMNAELLNNNLAQRIEQGIGRGARGPGDYCVVIITGKDIISWLSRTSNLRFLTSSTRAQIQMGREISQDIDSLKELWETIKRCLDRDKEWTEYHAETLAEYDSTNDININALKLADIERKAFRLFRDGYFEKAITSINKYCEDTDSLDVNNKGWLYQFIARIAYYWENNEVFQQFQKSAYACNRNLLRPQVEIQYVPLTLPGKQAEALVEMINKYNNRRGHLAYFDEMVSHLVPEASANQFEQALADLGVVLGFITERPDKTYGKGPDVLWLLNNELGLVIEAKSRKNKKNALTKEQHGQLLEAFEWFKKEYPTYKGIRVSMHPNLIATKSTTTGETKALTYNKLNELISNVRNLLVDLCESAISDEQLVIRCEKLLETSKLTPQLIIKNYFVPFGVE